jgi:phospholipase/carboxylesterase
MTIKNQKTLSCIEIDQKMASTHSIIWLHGLGADGGDFVPIVPALQLPDNLGIRFVFPHAPVMPVTVNNGYQMRAWYDIYGMNIDHRIDKTGMTQSIGLVEQLIENEVARGIPTNRIILAGFSQGAVIALLTGLRYAKPLAGILALSGYLPFADELLQQASNANRQVPIFIAHGNQDFIVPFALGEAAYLTLQQAGYPVEWHSYPIQHSVSENEIRDISHWLQQIIQK